jgi:hypothetical protein
VSAQSPSPQPTHAKSPSLPAHPIQPESTSPLALQTTDVAEPPNPFTEHETDKEQTTIANFLAPSQPSPPADPLAQANEVAAGLAIETPTEHAEHIHDPGNLSGAGGGIAGEGIVGGGTEDLLEPGVDDVGIAEERTKEDDAIVEQSKLDLETDVV